MAVVTLRKDGAGDYTLAQDAVDAAGLGGTVLVDDSETYTPDLGDFDGAASYRLSPPSGGWSGFTIRATGDNRPVFDGTTFRGTLANLDNRTGVTFEGIDFVRWSANGGGLVRAGNVSGILFSRCNFDDVNGLVKWPSGAEHAIVVERARCTNTTNLGEFLGGSSGLTLRNVLWDARGGVAFQGLVFGSRTHADMNAQHVTLLADDPAATGIVCKTVINSIAINVAASSSGDGIESNDCTTTFAQGWNTNFDVIGVATDNIDGDVEGVDESGVFVDYDGGDFTPLGLVRDSGSAVAGVDDDIDGNTRPTGDGWDMGAWEYVPAPAPEAEPEPDPVDEIDAVARAMRSYLPTGLLVTPAQRRFWRDVFEILSLPGVVLRRKIRVIGEQFNARTVEPQMIDWLSAQVGLDETQSYAASLPTAQRRTMIGAAPSLFKERGTLAGMRSASKRGGPYPSGLFDWFARRVELDEAALPWFGVAGDDESHETLIHVPDPGPAGRAAVEEMVRLNLAINESARICYVDAFDNGSNGPGQWTPSPKIEDPPALRFVSGTYALRTVDTDATGYTTIVLVTGSVGGTFGLNVYRDPDTGATYRAAFAFGAASTAWSLDGAGTLASGTCAAVAGAVTMVQLDTYVDGSGTHLRLLVDGNLFAEVTDAGSHRVAGAVAVDVTSAVVVDFVDVFQPGMPVSVVQHQDVIK